jgi:hypothetical protein
MVAEADLVVSATLVAVTVTICSALTEDGGVYRPAGEIVPAPVFGLSAQVTAVLVAFSTVAVNCAVWPGVTVTAGGVTATATGGGMIVRLTGVVWVIAPPEAVIVSGYVPRGVALAALTVRVEGPPPAIGLGLKLAEAPLGNPLTLMLTLLEKPPEGVTVAV